MVLSFCERPVSLQSALLVKMHQHNYTPINTHLISMPIFCLLWRKIVGTKGCRANFWYYYWAANIQPILHWMWADDDSPAWCLMESSSCAPASLSALIASVPVSVRLKTGSNILVNSTLRIWRQLCKSIAAQIPPLCMPICKNPIFPPSLQDKAFELWFQNGIRTVRNVFVEGVFASFQQLAWRCRLPNTHLFRYLQVRDFYRHRYQDFPHTPADTPIDTILKAPTAMKGLISTLYNTILSLCSPSDQTLETTWSQDLNVDLSGLWESILLRVHSSSVCARHGLFNASFYIAYIGPSPDCPVFIATSTHCVINVDNIMVLLFICVGHVHPYIYTGFLYSPLSLMYFKKLWSHVHSWPYLVSCQIPLNYQNPNLIFLLFSVWLQAV